MAQSMYTYTPLADAGPGYIRLLEIVSAPGEPTKCSLKPFSLARAPPYDCLSYTWGDAIDYSISTSYARRPMIKDRHILITHVPERGCEKTEETFIRVTENLLDGLYQLGRHGYAQKSFQGNTAESGSGQPEVVNTKYLWIDAICINQDEDFSKEEKQNQVSMMGEIYEHAQKVIIWLGKDDEYSADACEVMERLSACDKDPENPINDPNSQRPSFAVDGVDIDDALDDVCKFLGMQEEDLIPTFQWQSYCSFLRRGWFGRVWVLQERFFAKQTEVLYGEHLVEWDTISRCASVLLRINAHVILQMMVLQLLGVQEITGAWLSDNRINNQSFFGVIHKDNAASLHLEDLLYYSRFVNATDPVDHIYALLGIWRESQIQRGTKPAEVMQMMPKYDKDPAEVYVEATIMAIRESGHLHIINLVQNGTVSRIPRLPSWVPDFSQSVRMQSLLKWSPGDDTVEAKSWMASQGLPYSEPVIQPIITQEGTTADTSSAKTGLIVSGLYLGSVSAIGPKHGEINYECRLVELLMLIPHHIEEKPASPYAWPQEAFWRTIINDTFRKCQPAKGEARLAFLLFMAMRMIELEDYLNSAKNDGDDPELVIKLTKLLKDAQSTFDRLSCNGQPRKDDDTESAVIFRSASEMAKLQKALQAEKEFDRGKNRPLCELMRDFEVSFWQACSGRKLFITVDGYFGVTTESLEVGDEVWILAGASTPFVLRRRPGKYEAWEVVGETYVHGVMYGERAQNADGLRQILLV